MDWQSPFIIYRITAEATVQEVYHAADLKKAKYWLTYIGLPGDVLCRTPAHPKHSQATKIPEYFSHKERSGSPMTDHEVWKNFARSRNFNFVFPESQQSNETDEPPLKAQS